MRRRLTACAAGAAFAVMIVASTGVAEAATQPFSTLAPGFTQQLVASNLPSAFGIAFASNGDLFASEGPLQRVDTHTTSVVDGSTISPTNTVTPAVAVGLGLVNGQNGEVYANTFGGVQELDATSGQPVGAAVGQPGNQLGITVDPQTGRFVYSAANGIDYVSADGTQSGTLAPGIASDGLVFDPTGNYLFAAVGGGVDVFTRAGTLVQAITLTGGAAGADGMAFHAGSPEFLVANDNSGDITRFDFPGGDYTKAPTQSLLASGGSRGDLTAVGSDGCLYVSQENTAFADGTVGGSGSIVKICPGFIPPTPVATKLVAQPYLLGLFPGLSLNISPVATLTANGNPLAGEPITFSADGQTLCTGTTNASGVATCTGSLSGLLSVVLGGLGYSASFAGDGAYQATTAHGTLVTVLGIGLL